MKVLRLGQSLCSSGGSSVPDPDFVFTADTTIAGSSGVGLLTLPAAGVWNCKIDWGDGTSDSSVTTSITHDYTATSGAGVYTVRISGTVVSFGFNNAGDKLKMKNISNWGIYELRNSGSFYGCTNLTCSATDKASVGTTDFRNHFRACIVFNGAIGNWDTGSFVRMDRMFQSANAFDQNLGNWTIKACANFNAAFFKDSGAFSTASLDGIYIGWAAQATNIPIGSTVDFQTSKYSAGAAATARAVLTSAPYNWTITDGGQA